VNSCRPRWIFLADAIALDFLNSIAPPAHLKIAPLLTSEELFSWLYEAKLMPSEAIHFVREIAVLEELETVATQSIALGEWFRKFISVYKGKTVPATATEELKPLNRILERDLQFGQVDANAYECARRSGSALTWRSLRQWRSPDSLLLPLAQAMAELVCNHDLANVRQCEGPGCSLLFLDRTRGRTRRWCSMTACGNRAKQAIRRGTAQEQ
jgi:predicted RNA-binding Zn ribbon-like protein